MKNKTNNIIDSIFLLIVGILFIILPSKMIELIGLILGIYLLIKALIGYLLPHIFPLSRLSAGINAFLGILCLLLWGFLVKFIMVLLGVILLGNGISSLSKTSFNLKDKSSLLNTILGIIITLCGASILVTSLMNAGHVLGIIAGVILIIIAILSFIKTFTNKNDNEYAEQSTSTKRVRNETEIIDVEIVSEKHTHE